MIRGYRVPPAQKESTACSQPQNDARRADWGRCRGTKKSAGIKRDAGGSVLNQGNSLEQDDVSSNRHPAQAL
jgi:hypothetical protein